MPFSLGIPKKATSPLIAFKERIWIASPGPTSTVPKDPSPRCSPTVATSTGAAGGAGAAVVGVAEGAAVVAAAAGAAVVAAGAGAGAASSAASEPQAPTTNVNDKPSASRTRPSRRMVNFPSVWKPYERCDDDYIAMRWRFSSLGALIASRRSRTGSDAYDISGTTGSSPRDSSTVEPTGIGSTDGATSSMSPTARRR